MLVVRRPVLSRQTHGSGRPGAEVGHGGLVLPTRSVERDRWGGCPTDLSRPDGETHGVGAGRGGDRRQPFGRQAVHDVASARPEQGTDTHGAWLARGHDGSGGQQVEQARLLQLPRTRTVSAWAVRSPSVFTRLSASATISPSTASRAPNGWSPSARAATARANERVSRASRSGMTGNLPVDPVPDRASRDLFVQSWSQVSGRPIRDRIDR